MDKQFETVLNIVLGWEKHDYTNDPTDPGGPTKFGITLATLRQYRRDMDLTEEGVKKLEKPEAEDIYLSMYYEPVGGDQVSLAYATVLFDTAVNVGVGRAVKWLQAIVGTKTDGVFGPKTRKALEKKSPKEFVTYYLGNRLVYYASRPHWSEYGLGWSRRVADMAAIFGSIEYDAPKVEAPKKSTRKKKDD